MPKTPKRGCHFKKGDNKLGEEGVSLLTIYNRTMQKCDCQMSDLKSMGLELLVGGRCRKSRAFESPAAPCPVCSIIAKIPLESTSLVWGFHLQCSSYTKQYFENGQLFVSIKEKRAITSPKLHFFSASRTAALFTI